MAYRKSLHRLLAVVLAAVLVLSCASSALAAGKPKQKIMSEDILCPGLDALFGNWYYSLSSVPVEVGKHGISQTLLLYDDSSADGWEKAETPTLHEISFVTGDDFLRNAVTFEESVDPDAEPAEGEAPAKLLTASIPDEILTQPGHAVYHIVLESESYRMETERDLWIVSFEQYQPFQVTGENVQLTVGIGQILNESDLLAAVITDNTPEIVEKLNQRSGEEMIIVRDTLCIFEIPYDEDTVTRDFRKTAWDEPTGFFKINKHGTYEFPITYYGGNIEYDTKIAVNVLSYSIQGPSTLKIGASGQYSVKDTDPDSGRTFTLAADGEDLTFDAATGTLTIEDEAYQGATFTVTATPSDGGAPVVLNGSVSSGLLSKAEFKPVEFSDGFIVPMLSALGTDPLETVVMNPAEGYSQTTDEEADYSAYEDVAVLPLTQFVEDAQTAVDCYDRVFFYDTQEIRTEEIEIGGHVARIAEATHTASYGKYYVGYLLLARNNHMLRIRLYSEPKTKKTGLPRVTLEDMKKVAEQIVYDETKAAATVEDGALTIGVSGKGTPAAVTAGKKVQFTSTFAGSDKLKKAKSISEATSVEWSVVDAETGDAVSGVSISDKGLLSSDKKLPEPKNVIVKVYSPVFRTSAEYPLSVIPPVSKITAEPEAVFFYVGNDATETVKAVLEPSTVPAVGITWKLKKGGVVEVTPGEDGTAVFKPIAAGKTSVTVAEPGGKKVVVNASVVEPVTDLELSLGGKQVPGGTVSVKTAFTPKKPGNSKVELSLDVGEDIATITAKGNVKIAKTAPVGTVITVTCKALGAPEPIERTIQITVAEK